VDGAWLTLRSRKDEGAACSFFCDTFTGMTRSSSAAIDANPTPAPASEERPNTRECFRQVLGRLDGDGLNEASELYGADVDRELEDIKAGRHPLQRGGRDLDAYDRLEAELAAIRKNRRL
jgi:hypothetical protein